MKEQKKTRWKGNTNDYKRINKVMKSEKKAMKKSNEKNQKSNDKSEISK